MVNISKFKARRVSTPGSTIVPTSQEDLAISSPLAVPAMATPDSTPSTSAETSVSSSTSNRPKQYMTKTKKIYQKVKVKLIKTAKFDKAVKDFEMGKFKSLRKCAAFYKVPSSTLHRMICNGDKFQGSGPVSKCLSFVEEKTILDHVKWRSTIGCGVDFLQLQSLVQESLLALKAANLDRTTGYESTGQWPDRSYVRRMVERHNMSLRRTAEISKGRQVLTVSDLRFWQKDTMEFFSSKPALLAAFQDPSRIFNMDETSVQIGSSGHRVLAEKNTKVLYSISSGSRDHITASYMVSANGAMVPLGLISRVLGMLLLSI